MFNKEKIENLEKRVKELERIEGISKLSEDVSKRLIHALIDSNNEVVKRVFDDVCVRSVYGTSVFQPPKAGDIHASNAVFNGIPDSLKKVESVLLKDNSGCKNCAFFKGELKDLCMQINCLNRGRQLIFKRVRR